MTGLPFDYTTSVKEGKLFMDANGQVGELTPTGADTFDAAGRGTITFVRENAIVTRIKMNAMGFSFDGVKE
jgi:hypothetical protein